MSHPANKPPAQPAEVSSEWSALPIFLIGLFALLAYWGMVYLDNHGGSFDAQVYAPYASRTELEEAQIHENEPPWLATGKKVFIACSACHQQNALGVAGQYPPLAGSDWVNAKSPDRMIRIVLNGLQGPLTVNGQSYNNQMNAWKGIYSDEEIAAVITYVRSKKDWNNTASEVTADQVKKIRTDIKAKDSAFSSDELLKIPVN